MIPSKQRMEDEDMKRWARRNLPTVVLLTALVLLAALVLAIAMPQQEAEPALTSSAIPQKFDEAAYQSRLLDEAYAPVERETADIPRTYDLPEPPQEADSEPCGKGGFVDAQPAMDLSRDKNAEEMKWSPLEMGAAMQAHGA